MPLNFQLPRGTGSADPADAGGVKLAGYFRLVHFVLQEGASFLSFSDTYEEEPRRSRAFYRVQLVGNQHSYEAALPLAPSGASKPMEC